MSFASWLARTRSELQVECFASRDVTVKGCPYSIIALDKLISYSTLCSQNLKIYLGKVPQLRV